ncbi:hypothetical protein ES703_14269 [subsurface metagenome]
MKRLEFGILRSESRFSDLSPSLQKLFNKGSREALLKQEAEELENEGKELTNEELDTLLEDVSPEEAAEIIATLEEIVFREENREIALKEKDLAKVGLPSKLRKHRRRVNE